MHLCLYAQVSSCSHIHTAGLLLSTQTGRLPAYNISSLAVPLSNGQLMINTHAKALVADLAHTTRTKL